MANAAPLFQPYRLKDLLLPNRIVMAPMTRNFAPGGVPGEDVAAYYRRRIEGGTGLIVTEGIGIDHGAAIGEAGFDDRKSDIPLLYGAGAIAGWKRVVDAVHSIGGLIIPQLWHMGPFRTVGTGPHPEAPVFRPSGSFGPVDRRTSTEPAFLDLVREPVAPPSDSDIQDVVDAFGRSAAVASGIGFDGIAVHGAHGYLIDSFLWAETNSRSDRWGGDLRRRAEFAVAVVKSIRRAVGARLPIFFRFSQWKQQDFDAQLANTSAELEMLLCPLAEAGVDVFDASVRHIDRPAFEGSNLSLAGWAKQLTGCTSMAVGGVGIARSTKLVSVNNLDAVITRFIAGEYDLVAVGRALLNDPRWAMKVMLGEPFDELKPDAFNRLL